MSGLLSQAPEVDDTWKFALGRLAPGATLGDCELLMPVARGGMGVVWAARRRNGDGSFQNVALKTMLASLAADARYEKMFLTEARLASRIHHPNVCHVLEHGERRGVLYLAMEWIDGEPLASLLADQQPLPYGIAVAVAIDAAHGLHAAHEASGDDGAPLGLVHRDVSPRNLLVAEDEGRVVVTDFGVAKATLRRGTSTTGGIVKGTVRYLAPEQVYSEDVDRRADVFALGCVLYEATTGVAPFAAQTDLGVLAKIAGPDAAPSPTSVPGYPHELAHVVERALRKAPGERYATMLEFAEALKAASATFGIATSSEVAAFVRGKVGERVNARKAAIGRAATEIRSPLVMRSEGSGSHRIRGLLLGLGLTAGALIALVSLLRPATPSRFEVNESPAESPSRAQAGEVHASDAITAVAPPAQNAHASEPASAAHLHERRLVAHSPVAAPRATPSAASPRATDLLGTRE